MHEHSATPRDTGLKTHEWLWLTITATGLAIVYFSPLREYLTRIHELKQQLSDLGPLGPVIFVAAMMLLTAAGVPRLLLYPISGMAFGFAGGLAWGMAGTLGGAYITFAYARWAGRGIVMKKWPRIHRLTGLLDGHGFVTVALLRQLPIPGYVTNLFFGVSPIGHSAFIAGTLIGCLPSAIPAVLIGSSVTQMSADSRLAYVSAALFCLLALWLGFSLFFKHSSRFSRLRDAWKSSGVVA